MSDDVIETKKPAQHKSETVTDSLGRVLEVKQLSAMEYLDVLEAAGGERAENRRWMQYASIAAMVRKIDQLVLLFPKDKSDLRHNVNRLGDEGFAAVAEWLNSKAAADQQEQLDTAKNSQGTPDSGQFSGS